MIVLKVIQHIAINIKFCGCLFSFFLSKNVCLFSFTASLAVIRASARVLDQLAHIQFADDVRISFRLIERLRNTFFHAFICKIGLLFLHNLIDLLIAIGI